MATFALKKGKTTVTDKMVKNVCVLDHVRINRADEE